MCDAKAVKVLTHISFFAKKAAERVRMREVKSNIDTIPTVYLPP